METTMNDIHPNTTTSVDEAPQPNAGSRPAPRAGRSGDDVVRWAEFRLALWIGGFALAVIISGQGLLFSAILNLQGEMHRQFSDLRAEIHEQHNGLRAEMHEQNNSLRVEMHEQNNSLRAEMHEQNNSLRTEMHEQNNGLRVEIQKLSERLIRIETQLGINPAAGDREN